VEARRRALGEALRANPAMRPAEALRELPEVFDRQTLDLIASFQYAVVGNLMRQTFAAAEARGARGIVVSGGGVGEQRAAAAVCRRGGTARAAGGVPDAGDVDRQRGDDCGCGVGKFCAGEFAKEGLVAVPQLRLGSRY